MPYDDDDDDDRRRRRRRRRDEDDDDFDDDDEYDIGQDPATRLLIPVGLTPWAIAAGYLALFSVLILPGPLALFTGIMAVREINRNPKKHGMGRAIFGIVMGSLATLVLLVFLVAWAVGRK